MKDLIYAPHRGSISGVFDGQENLEKGSLLYLNSANVTKGIETNESKCSDMGRFTSLGLMRRSLCRIFTTFSLVLN
jgi:hypothetical protein